MYICDTTINRLGESNFAELYKGMFAERWQADTPYQPFGLVSDFNPEYVDGNSIELQLDTVFQFDEDCTILSQYNHNGIKSTEEIEVKKGYSIDLSKYHRRLSVDKNALSVVVPAGGKFLCQSRQTVQVPPHLIGFIYVRSSYARMWINHMTSQVIKPTFSGHITFEFINHSSESQTVSLEDPIIQLLLAECEIPAVPYAVSKSSRYQNQKNQLSKVSAL